MRPRRRSVLPLALALLASTALVGSQVSAADLNESKGFRKAVTLAGIREHQQAFQGFADANNGIRAAGTPGHDASAQYVHDRMAAAGYEVSFQEFTFPFVGDRTPPIFQRITAPAATYIDGVDFGTMQYSGSGDVTAPVWAVDLLIPPGAVGTNTSGCQAADFAGMPIGSIALIQRGNCFFIDKANNARAAGAAAIVIFNEGQAGRTAGVFGTLGAPIFDRPVLSASFAIGDSLRNGVLSGPTGITARVKADTVEETRTTRNVIAETPDGDPNRVVVVGAHLDSVTRGPGINDNGSGSGTILEIAEVYAAQGRDSRNKLRFMWYSAEENGLIGSQFYVNSLSDAEQDQIMAMVNFDMVGSPNYVRFVYDGDNSAFPVGPGAAEGPPGSAYLEDLFIDYFNGIGLANDPTPFSGRSDYGPFIAVGIPAGGLFTGAEGIKTAAQAATYGGLAGTEYDPCYHLACDTFAGTGSGAGATAPGLALKGLDEMSDAAAHVVLTLSRVKVDVRQTEAVPALRTSGSLVADSPGPEALDER